MIPDCLTPIGQLILGSHGAGAAMGTNQRIKKFLKVSIIMQPHAHPSSERSYCCSKDTQSKDETDAFPSTNRREDLDTQEIRFKTQRLFLADLMNSIEDKFDSQNHAG